MLDNFPRSAHTLERDGFGRTLIVLALVAVLVGTWIAWFFLARLRVYEVSDAARLELARAVHAIEAPVGGRVVSSNLMLDRQVAADEVLLTLDVEPTRLRLEEERSRLESLAPQIAALEREIRAHELALEEDRGASSAGLEEARARAREANIAAEFAEQELERMKRLHGDGQISDADLARARSDAEERRAAAESARLAGRRLDRERGAAGRDREAHLEQLRREKTRLDGEVAAAVALIDRLEHEMKQRIIRAPVGGTLAEVAAIEAGAFISEGDRIGAVLGRGNLRVTAEYAPSAALGRVRPGQRARLRLEGFPWAQYGSVGATVTGVATELRDRRIRVELDIDAVSETSIPLQHGLPGSVEIEIERVAPVVLVLRAVGRLLSTPTDSEA
jgi:membrane fusion protein (multidrug efflux system)